MLDSSVIIHSFRKKNNVEVVLNGLSEAYVSTVVIGELFYGAYKSDDVSRHVAIVKSFPDKCTILPIDYGTADTYGAIKTMLIKKGKPIPENDIWIAATALQHELPLFTTDEHFKEVQGIVLF